MEEFYERFSMSKFANKETRSEAIENDWNAKQEEIASLKSQLGSMRRRFEDCSTESIKMSMQLAECKKDAERYRFLRDSSNDVLAESLIKECWESGLDQAIDAAISAQKEEAK